MNFSSIICTFLLVGIAAALPGYYEKSKTYNAPYAMAMTSYGEKPTYEARPYQPAYEAKPYKPAYEAKPYEHKPAYEAKPTTYVQKPSDGNIPMYEEKPKPCSAPCEEPKPCMTEEPCEEPKPCESEPCEADP